MKTSPLDDPSFFRFPDLTSEVVRNIFLLLVVISLTIAVTILVQRWIYAVYARRRFHDLLGKFAAERHLAPPHRELLGRLAATAGVKRVDTLMQDAGVYESAVQHLIGSLAPEEIGRLHHLRRVFHLNVMNPNLKLVSTRQLLPELPIRLVTGLGSERLDLYCTLLDVDEEQLVFDLHHDDSIFRLLRENPQVVLVFWREEEGETPFRITLEQAPAGLTSVFRAEHAFRDETLAQRTDFRLSVDFPVEFHYMAREHLKKFQRAGGESPSLQKGEARLVDLSYGGAAFLARQALPPGGFAQLQFEIHGHPLRMMVEVIGNAPQGEEQVLVRGRLRGMPHESQGWLFSYLSREQIRRLRDSGAFHLKSPA